MPVTTLTAANVQVELDCLAGLHVGEAKNLRATAHAARKAGAPFLAWTNTQAAIRAIQQARRVRALATKFRNEWTTND